MSDSPASVVIYRGPDELQAELIRAALESAGVTVRVYGLRRGASIGAGEQVVDVRVVVPATQRERARRALEDLTEAAELADAVTDATDPAAAGTPPTALRPRRRLFAAVATFIAPGLGQVYAQHQASGGLLLAASVLALSRSYLGMASGSLAHGRAFLATLVIAWLVDLTLSQRAITARRAGRPHPEATAQLGAGALQAALVLGIAWILISAA